jgi:DNA-binding CsgD family transcriptional regulator
MNMVYINKASPLSSARKSLDPLDVIEIVHGATDITSAWAVMSEKLGEAGFETCAFAIGNRNVDTPIGHPDTHYWGSFITDQFTQFMTARPEMQKITPALQLVRRANKPLMFFGDELTVPEKTDLHKEFNKFMQSFNLKGRVMAPFNEPDDDRTMAVGWWDFGKNGNARKLWERKGLEFSLAAAYFAEGVRDDLDPVGKGYEPLSSRERECLLWVAAGRRTGEIAHLLSISEATVNEYLSRAMRKLGASTRSQACAKAILRGVFTP